MDGERQAPGPLGVVFLELVTPLGFEQKSGGHEDSWGCPHLETNLCDVTGTPLPKTKDKASKPNLRWASCDKVHTTQNSTWGALKAVLGLCWFSFVQPNPLVPCWCLSMPLATGGCEVKFSTCCWNGLLRCSFTWNPKSGRIFLVFLACWKGRDNCDLRAPPKKEEESSSPPKGLKAFPVGHIVLDLWVFLSLGGTLQFV